MDVCEDKIEDIISICIMCFAFLVLCLVVATQNGTLFWMGMVGAVMCLVNVRVSISTLRTEKTFSQKKGPAEAGPGRISSPQGKVAPEGDGDIE